jgi:hypothetical protein
MVLAYLGSQCTKFHTAGFTCWFFMSFYLESCIWPDAILQWIWQKNNITFCENLRNSAMETLAMIRQVFGEESMSHTRKVQTHGDWKKKVRQVKSKVKIMLIIFFDIKWIVHKKIYPVGPNNEVRILLWLFTMAAWMCAKISPRTLATKELAVASRQHTLKFFTKNAWLSSLTCPTFLCFPDWS